MAILCRLPIRDRLASWGMSVPLHCVLCGSGLESHDHLFFHCPFSTAIWTHYCSSSNLPIPSSIISVGDLLSLQQVVDSYGLPVVLKLLLQSIVYCVWRERNSRIFAGTSISEAAVVKQVDRLLRDLLISFPSLSSSHHSLLQVYFSLNHPP